MSSAREDILARLHGSTDATQIMREADTLLIAPERPMVDPSRLEEAFVQQVTSPTAGATCDSIARIEDLPAAISRYLADNGAGSMIYLPPDPRLMICDWSAFTLHDRAETNEVAALAVARMGIAETGSLIFETGPHAPMLPNFLTLHHIVLLRTGDIAAHLEDAPPAGAQPRAHYWVTGVSGTTDIEGTYVRGAHGPRFLHIILLRDEPAL